MWAPPSDTPNSMCGYCTISCSRSDEPCGGAAKNSVAQPVGDGDVEHRVDGVLAGEVGDLAHRHLAVRARSPATAAASTVTVSSGAVATLGSLSLRPWRRAGSAELVQALLERAGGRLHPRLGVVVEVPVLEREREPGVGRDALAVDRDAPLAAALQPLDRLAVDVRPVLERLHHVVQHRPPGQRGDLLEVGDVVADVVGRQRDLLHALVAPGEHAGEHAARLVVHHVGRHRRAVPVALHGGRARRRQALRRPPAPAGVHRLVEQRRRARACSSSVGRRPALASSRPRTSTSIGPAGTYGRMLSAFGVASRLSRNSGNVTQSHGRPWRIDSYGIASTRVIERIAYSRSSGCDRREAEAAVADRHRRDAVPARQRAGTGPRTPGRRSGCAGRRTRARRACRGRRRTSAASTASTRPIAAMRPSLIADVAAHARRAGAVEDAGRP